MSQNFNIENSFEKKNNQKTKLNYQIKKEKPSKMSSIRTLMSLILLIVLLKNI